MFLFLYSKEVAEGLGIATFSPGNFNIPTFTLRKKAKYSYREAKNHLQFQSMILLAHQVELLFVFCTLLSGRRKLDVQERFARLGLVGCLYDMFDRLSWGYIPLNNPNTAGHIHGPNCDCDPESAIRIQVNYSFIFIYHIYIYIDR